MCHRKIEYIHIYIDRYSNPEKKKRHRQYIWHHLVGFILIFCVYILGLGKWVHISWPQNNGAVIIAVDSTWTWCTQDQQLRGFAPALLPARTSWRGYRLGNSAAFVKSPRVNMPDVVVTWCHAVYREIIKVGFGQHTSSRTSYHSLVQR